MTDDTNGSEPPADATDGGGEQAPQGQGRPTTATATAPLFAAKDTEETSLGKYFEMFAALAGNERHITFEDLERMVRLSIELNLLKMAEVVERIVARERVDKRRIWEYRRWYAAMVFDHERCRDWEKEILIDIGTMDRLIDDQCSLPLWVGEVTQSLSRLQTKRGYITRQVTPVRAPIPRDVHIRLAKSTKCYYCLRSGTFSKDADGRTWHIDHTEPVSRAYQKAVHYVRSCARCNLEKHDRYPHEWPEGGRLL